MSKTLYFHEKTVIISLFLVRFQIRLIHMTVLFILHVTKEKISKKYFRQVYRGCQIAKKIVCAHSHRNNSKSIALRIIPNNSARSWHRRLKKNIYIIIIIGQFFCERSPSVRARLSRPVTDEHTFMFLSLSIAHRMVFRIGFRSWSRALSFLVGKS